MPLPGAYLQTAKLVRSPLSRGLRLIKARTERQELTDLLAHPQVCGFKVSQDERCIPGPSRLALAAVVAG